MRLLSIKSLFFVIATALFSSLYPATIIAVNDGDWNASSTWAKQISGTLSFTSGSTTVTGTGTNFANELGPHYKLYDIDGNLLGSVSSITNNTSLELESASATTASGIDCFAPWLAGGPNENGRITTNNASAAVSGTVGFGATFFTFYTIGTDFYYRAGFFPNFTYHYLGAIASITDNANCSFVDNATETVANQRFYRGGFPGTADENDFIIPQNITVTIPSGFNSGNLSQSMFTSLDISGNLIVEGATVLDQWALPDDAITVRSGGKLTVSNDFSFIRDRTILSVEAGGELFIGGNLSDDGTGDTDINNQGYIEVMGEINSRQIQLTNQPTGVLVVHGQIKGNGSQFKIDNFGIITADLNLNLDQVKLHNHAEGQILVFGDITITGGTVYDNDGLVQCLNMNFDNLTGFSNTGTTIVQETFSLNWSGCPCSLGDFYANNIALLASHYMTADGCDGAMSCSDYWLGVDKVPESRKIWLAADFIGYGQQKEGELIYRWFDLANSFGFKLNETNDAYKPVLKNNSADNLNFSPVLSFSGGEKHLDLDANYLYADATDGGIAFFAVVIPESGGSADQLIFDFGNNTSAGFGFGYSDENAYVYTPTANGGAVLQESAHGRTTTPSLVSMKVSFGAQQEIYIDGASVASNSNSLTNLTSTVINESPSPTGSAGPVTIGGKSADPSSFDFEGKLAEMLIYSKDIHDTVWQSTQSYLALKYGITISGDYTDYNNKTIWDSDPVYQHDIAGLAREDLNLLHQGIATSANMPGELIVSMGAIDGIVDKNQLSQRIDTNSTYLVWGHNNGSLSSGSRIYKIRSTQFNQDVNLQFNIPGVTDDPLLVVAEDDSFTANLDFVNPISHTGDKVNYTYRFPKNKTCYFKLLIISQTKGEPGLGINTTTVDSTAALHISSGDKGILLPALADETAISSSAPPTGLLFYNTTHSRFMYNAGTPASPIWKFIGAPLKQSDTDLQNSSGSYEGEIRYNTTTQTMWMWDGTNWLQLKND